MHRRNPTSRPTTPAARCSSPSFSARTPPTLTVPSVRSDEELLESLLAGESEQNWRAFLARFEGLVRSTIVRAVRARRSRLSNADFEDLRASFLASLLANDRHALRAFDPRRGLKLRSWLVILAEHHGVDWARAQSTRARYVEADLPLREADLREQPPTPEELALRKELHERMRGALRTLGDRQRELYDLYFEQDLAPSEVAGRMGTTLQTVHSGRHKLELRLTSAVLGSEGSLPAAA